MDLNLRQFKFSANRERNVIKNDMNKKTYAAEEFLSVQRGKGMFEGRWARDVF